MPHLPGVQVATGEGALVAGLLGAWFGVLVEARGPLVGGAVLAVGLALLPLVDLVLRHPAAWGLHLHR